MSVERAHALLDLGRPEQALAALAGLGPEGDSAPAHGLRAVALLRLQRLPEAETAAAAARAADPGGEEGYRLGAVAALRSGHLRRSGALAAEAVRLDPGEAATHHVASLVQLELGDLPAAARHAEEVLRLAPDEALSHQTHARVLLAQHRYPDAEQALRRALALDPQDDESMALLAEATSRQGRHDEAAELRLSALRADPQNPRHQQGLLARGGQVAGGVVGVGLVKAFGLSLAINSTRHLPGLRGKLLMIAVVGYAVCFVVSRRRRVQRGRALPPLVWEGLLPTRRNADLQWLAWPAVLVVLVSLPVAAVSALRGQGAGGALVWAGCALVVLAACWLLRRGAARELTLRQLAQNCRLLVRYLWEQLRAARDRRTARSSERGAAT